MTIVVTPMSANIRKIAESGSYRQDEDLLPARYKAVDQDAVKDEILEHLRTTALMNLTTCTPEGWPAGHCMHFSTVYEADKRPVIYMFTHEHTRKLVNIAHDPRVSFSCYKAVSFERRRETRAFYARGLAKAVETPEEWAVAEKAHAAKPGQAYVKLIRADNQPLLRIDVLQGVWHNPQRRPQHGRVDFDFGSADA